MRPHRSVASDDVRLTTPAEAGVERAMPRLLTLPEVATYLSVSAKTVRRLSASGRLPHFRVGRVLRFDLADVSRWLTARRVR